MLYIATDLEATPVEVIRHSDSRGTGKVGIQADYYRSLALSLSEETSVSDELVEVRLKVYHPQATAMVAAWQRLWRIQKQVKTHHTIRWRNYSLGFLCENRGPVLTQTPSWSPCLTSTDMLQQV